MAKKYINGSDKFKIVLIDASGHTETLNFSFRYQALNEYDQTKITRHKFRTGNKKRISHFVELEWEIDFSGLLDQDHQLIEKVKNADFENKKIWLMPHIDVPHRSFEVLLMESDKRKLGQYYNSRQTGPNKDYVLWFENAKGLTRHNWIDPDAIPVIALYDILIIN